MPLTIIRASPEESSYTPLSAFQSETPESFVTPVLHSHQADNRVLISSDQISLIPIFVPRDSRPGDSAADEVSVEGIDLWVTNECGSHAPCCRNAEINGRCRNLIFFNKPLSVGAIVPYPSLTLHAIQRLGSETGLYMQISLTPDILAVTNSDGYDDDEVLELSLLPKATGQVSQADAAGTIFKALAVCTGLHSAASSSEDEGGDGEDRILFEGDGDETRLQGFPGEGGWITAENAHQFQFDDIEGGDEPYTILGPGAGIVRRREGAEDVANVASEPVEELKWRRTG